MDMGCKALWNNKEVTILEVIHKSSFGDFIRIKVDGETKIVNSEFLIKIK